MTVTIQDSSPDQLDVILGRLTEHGIGAKKVKLDTSPSQPTICWAQEDSGLSELFGVWASAQRSLEQLREK